MQTKADASFLCGLWEPNSAYRELNCMLKAISKSYWFCLRDNIFGNDTIHPTFCLCLFPYGELLCFAERCISSVYFLGHGMDASEMGFKSWFQLAFWPTLVWKQVSRADVGRPVVRNFLGSLLCNFSKMCQTVTPPINCDYFFNGNYIGAIFASQFCYFDRNL